VIFCPPDGFELGQGEHRDAFSYEPLPRNTKRQ